MTTQNQLSFLGVLLCLALLGSGCRNELPYLADIDSLDIRASSKTFLQELAWSPDGQSVAARININPGQSGVAVIDLRSGSATTVYEATGFYSHGPEWSPDGSLLVLSSPPAAFYAGPGKTDWKPPYSVLIIDPQTGDVINNAGFGTYAAWTNAPDKVIVLAWDAAQQEMVLPIYEFDLTTRQQREIGQSTPASALYGNSLDVSTLGQLLVRNQDRLQFIDIAAGHVVADVDIGSGYRSPVYSPDGTMIAFIQYWEAGNGQAPTADIVLASAIADCFSEPLPLGTELLSLDWSPQGDRLVFSTKEENRLYFLNLTDGSGKVLLDEFRQQCKVGS